MKKMRNKFFTTYYFKNYIAINLLLLFIILSAGLVIQISIYTVFIYFIVLLGLAIYASINYELGRIFSCLGATLFFLVLGRSLVAVGLRGRVGVFAQIDPEQVDAWYRFLISDVMGLITALIIFGGVLCLITDMYVAVKHMSDASNNFKNDIPLNSIDSGSIASTQGYKNDYKRVEYMECHTKKSS